LNSGYNVFKDQNIIDAGTLPSLKEIFKNKKTNSWEIYFNIDKASESTKTSTSKAGKIFLEVFGYPVLDSNEKIEFVVLQHHDITERKRAEDVLNKFFDQPMHLNLIAGLDGIIHRVNNSWEVTLGYSKKELENTTFLDFIHPDDIAATTEEMARLDKGITTFYFENRYQHKNGSYRLLAWSAIASIEDQMIYAVANDITEKTEMERHIQQTQKMESIGNLAGGIAHDFNNLLFPILGMSEMLIEDLSEDSLEYENALEIFKAGKRAGELVNQILAFSRQSEHKMSPVRVQNVLKEVLKLSRSTIPSNVEIHQNIQQNCGLVMADPTQIHQIVMNLITNASHAVEDKNGVIDIELKELSLKYNDLSNSELQPGAYIKLSVSDNGIGMSQDTIKKIFEPYFTTKKKGKGTGLGLAVVFGIIIEHKGEIKVNSEIGKGTTFNVYMPLMKKTSDRMIVNKVTETAVGTENILLVDDEVSVAKLEGQMLSRLGYDVTVEISSIDAINAFKLDPNSFDLVISDMTMPNMTGDQLAKELLSIKSDIPIIICTGFSARINKEQAEAIGVKGFLMKPVVKSDMAQMVRKVLDEANVYKEN